MKKTLILTTLIIFGLTLMPPNPTYAEENPSLRITDHKIEIRQVAGEEQQDRLEVLEQITFENFGKELYQDLLQFDPGPTAKDISLVGVPEQQDAEGIEIPFEQVDQGIVVAQLSKTFTIEAGGEKTIQLFYAILPEQEGNYLWQKKFLYPHEKNQTALRINPTESLGYTTKAQGFNLEKKNEGEGWLETGLFTPKVGTPYSILLKRGEVQSQEKAQQEQEKGPAAIIHEQIRKLVFENILLTLLLNDALVLGVVLLIFKRK